MKKEIYQLQYNANQVTLIFRESSEEITIDVNRFTVLPKNMKVDFNQRLTGNDGFASFFNKRVMANSELSIFRIPDRLMSESNP